MMPWRTPPKRDISGDEARRAYARLVRDSKTWLYRVAIRSDSKLVPLEANARLAPRDLELSWDGEHQEWKGLEGPDVWEMAQGYDRKRGDLKPAVTYASNIEAKLGDIITVQTVRLERFEEEDGSHYSWMFPRVKELNPDKDRPDTVEDFERLIAASQKAALSKASLREPGGGAHQDRPGSKVLETKTGKRCSRDRARAVCLPAPLSRPFGRRDKAF